MRRIAKGEIVNDHWIQREPCLEQCSVCHKIIDVFEWNRHYNKVDSHHDHLVSCDAKFYIQRWEKHLALMPYSSSSIITPTLWEL